MILKVFNTLTRTKEEFKPMTEKKVKFFVCGPTVYDYSHLGHAKTYTQFDIIVKYLRYKGYDVHYLQNITDIDDKIINRAKEEGKTYKEIAEKYEEEYKKDMKSLGNDSVTQYARATDYIPQIIRQVKKLMEKGYAYETSDGIYYEVNKFKEYGKLSKNPLEKLKGGARISVNEEKKHPYDFVLWKKAKPGEPSWDSPWGPGRPGWHIEDTAITESIFGEQYDAHGGAEDLIFPHHECEIAQMEAASGKKPFVKYWLHTAFLNMGTEKMGKSLGNFKTTRETLKEWDGKTIRYLFASQHYKTPISFNEQILEQAKKGLERINNYLQDLKIKKGKGSQGRAEEETKKLLTRFEEAMDDDFNTPQALAAIYDFIRETNKLDLSEEETKKIIETMKKIDQVLGIMTFEEETKIPEEIKELLEKRAKARKEKNWEESDRIREEIRKKGYEVADTPEGQIVKKK